ncbi:tetratricopeptide repeat protein [Tateyamaria sp. syn59]|uniref:tetratricopeptide repeat protein n=1 Tax=Tateyamaria sp. syn59 TaxID=2576942 RepID=UPI00167BB92C|nr:tetratricopeptide repeat protein [Tateyamaria sp. syn59]
MIALVGCVEPGTSGTQSFQSPYLNAREALEKGNYRNALRLYSGLLDRAGPLNKRIQLELAHVHLRSGDFEDAARGSWDLAQSTTGTDRSAALSVYATATHEIALGLLAEGDTSEGAKQLGAAQKAFDEVLRNDPQLDPLGSLQGRKASIEARLRNLG